MSAFSVKKTLVSTSSLSQSAQNPMFNSNKLQNVPIGSLDGVSNGDLLYFNGTEWSFLTPYSFTGTTGAIGTEIGPTGSTILLGTITGPTGLHGFNLQGITGSTGIRLVSDTGPTGMNASAQADTGPTGSADPIEGFTGFRGMDSSTDAHSGPTGIEGHSPFGSTGPTGISYNGNTDTGPTGPIGSGHSTDQHTGPTGPAGFISNEPMVGLFNINSLSVVNDVATTVGMTNVYKSSEFYLPSTSTSIGVSFGIWKVIVNANWAVGSGYRQISIVSLDDTITYATSSLPSASGVATNQPLTYIGNFNSAGAAGAEFKVVVTHGNSTSLNVSGTVSLFNYSTIIPSTATGPAGPNEPGAKEFAIRLVNHDTTHPPLKVGIFLQDLAGTAGSYLTTPITNGRPTQTNTPTPSTKVSTLFLDWSSLPIVDSDPNMREIVVGGDGVTYNSSQILISKTDLSYDSDLQLWTVTGGGVVGGVPQSYLDTASASNLTIDFVEFTYNKPVDLYTLFVNQTLVTGMTIPITLTLTYKNTGNRRIINGPVGLNKSMNTILNEYKPAATGANNPFWRTIRPDSTNPARLVAPQKLSGDDLDAFQSYMNDYVQTFWDAWLTPKQTTFYPQGPTGASDLFTNAELYTQGDFTTTGFMTVTPLGGVSGPGDAFTINASDIYNKTIDLIGASGVWITGNATQQAIKAIIAASIVRGVAHLSGHLFDTNSYQSNVSYAQTNWNGYRDRGSSFYQNQNVHVYGKVLHDQALEGAVDAFTLPYTYAISYDDVYGYSSTLTTAQIGTTPSTETQALRATIDIYENDNY